MTENTEENKRIADKTYIDSGYAKYVLTVLVVVYVFNFLDRQILSILAESIKADLGVTDSEMGFLYGTAFAIFYAIFGIPLGKLADVWTRGRLISIGIALWSVMTALSGSAKSFAGLAAFRFGVGVGEASASPAAFSMLSDYFSPRVRSTVLAIYSGGIYIGSGIGIFVGGNIVAEWALAYPDPALAPFGLKGWQVAFMAVGLPGILLAILVSTLREPIRGMSEGLKEVKTPHPFKVTAKEFASILPPLTFLAAWQAGKSRALIINIVIALVIYAVARLIIYAIGDPMQWYTLGFGAYATLSWIQILKMRDPAVFGMIFGAPSLILIIVGVAINGFATYALGFWGAPFLQRVHHVDLAEMATILGSIAAIGGLTGMILGGWLADKLKEKYENARLYVVLAAPLLAIPAALVFLTADNLWVVYGANLFGVIVGPMWIGPTLSTVNDMVMPRMRAVTSAFYILVNIFLGMALGPYMVGLFSDILHKGGMGSGEALQTSMMYSLGVKAIGVGLLFLALRYLARDVASRFDRARALGEPVETL